MESLVFDEVAALEEVRDLIDQIELDPDFHHAALLAIDWYSNELPYHNLTHMIEVAKSVVELCRLDSSIPHELKQMIFLAALWHDADYESPLTDEHVSKEHRSAELAHEAIMQTGPLDEDITRAKERLMIADRVATLIISTKEDKVPSDAAETILNQADLRNLSGDTIQMLRRSGAYFIEGLLLKGQVVVGSSEVVLVENLSRLADWCPDTVNRLTGMIDTKFGSAIIDRTTASTDNVTKLADQLKTNIKAINPVNILSAVKDKRT